MLNNTIFVANWDDNTVSVIFGGIGVCLAEHEHPGANITATGDALWWGIVTIATVGYVL